MSKDYINKNGYEYYLLNNGVNVIGFVSFLKDGNKLLLTNLYILEVYREKGYCELVIDKVIKNCQDTDIDRVRITLNKMNEQGIKFWSNLGFTKIEENVQDIGNGFVIDNYLLEKQI